MNQKKVFLLCGIPASGKSSLVRANLTPDSEWISRDNVRFSIVRDNEDYFSHEDEVFDTFINYINQMLDNPKVNNLFVDATHINKYSRAKTLNKIYKNKATEINAIYFTTPLETCIERNSKREGREKVPETAIKKMHSSFSPPTHSEGFNHIYKVDENGIVKEVSI